MNEPFISFDGDFSTTFMFLLIAGGLALMVSIWAGLRLAEAVRSRNFPTEDTDTWIIYSPLPPVLSIIAILLPLIVNPPILAGVALVFLLLPPIFRLAVRIQSIDVENEQQRLINQRAILTVGRRDIIAVFIAFLIGSFLRAAVSDAVPAVILGNSSTLLVGAAIGLVLGIVVGYGLWFARRNAANQIEKRRQQGRFDNFTDGALHTRVNLIENVLTKFHGTSLVGVLVITVAAVPMMIHLVPGITETGALVAAFFLPVASATTALLLARDTSSKYQGFWRNLRTGVSNVMQISASYLVGLVLLIPLDFVHQWMVDDPDEVLSALSTHLELTFLALTISMILGITGGILSSRFEIIRTILTGLGNLGRTLPSLAVLALALPLVGIGRTPSMIALIFIGTLPILVNTTVGITNVAEDIKEAARGMGMNNVQMLFQVEIPIAIPVIMAGIRTAAVLVVASAALAGFIGGGGLGALIIRGNSSGREDILFTGAILSTMLAIFLEYLFSWFELMFTPRGLRITA